MKKEVRIQIRLDGEDLKVLEQLVRAKRYGSNRSEVLRRCMYETHAAHLRNSSAKGYK